MKLLCFGCMLFACTVMSMAQTAEPVLQPGPAARILEQASWGPTQAAIADLQSKGLANWLNEQFEATPSTIPDQPTLSIRGFGTNQNMAPLAQNFFLNAVSGPDQLRQRVAFALSEIWVVSEINAGNASAFPPLLRIFQNEAFGNYEKLMRDLTLNPALGQYLNLANNIKGSEHRGPLRVRILPASYSSSFRSARRNFTPTARLYSTAMAIRWRAMIRRP